VMGATFVCGFGLWIPAYFLIKVADDIGYLGSEAVRCLPFCHRCRPRLYPF
jgi:hypothetical protein